MRFPLFALAVLLVTLAPAPGVAQRPAAQGDLAVIAPAGNIRGASPTSAVAARAAHAPAIDGRAADAIWSTAQSITGFRQFAPKEDGEPAFRTEAKVAYDERYLYVLVRAFDPHPDSILQLLSRRDVRTASDQIKVVVDSYHDRRSGYQFMLNPAGVKRDANVFNDSQEDMSWDAVWDGAATVDSLGWVAEFRIPFSQLRFPSRSTHTFGFAIWRDIARLDQRDSWPIFRPSRTGFVSQLGELHGIADIATPRHLEVTPYSIAKTESRERDVGYGRVQSASVGADVKYGLTSNLTLDAAINPDFGQVEADPAELNLSAFEQFFAEQRPFFLEGNGIFRFDLSCDDECTSLFYSRRIGRSPQLSGLDDYSDAGTPTATTMLAAAKLTGRTARGLSIGVLDAVTQREVGLGDRTVEPQTNYFVARLQQDLRGGRSGVGLMLTGVNRQLDAWSEPYLRARSYTGGLDVRHRFADDRYELAGYAMASYVGGDTAAIRRTQENSVHSFQRPDDGIALDAARTSLTGTSQQISLAKQGGGITRFKTAYQRASPGFEINDAGFLPRTDQQTVSNWFAFVFNEPRHFYRRAEVEFNQRNVWTTTGARTDLGGDVNADVQFTNMWEAYVGVGVGQLGGSVNDRSARGGPAIFRSPTRNVFGGVSGDARRAWVPFVDASAFRGDYGRTRSFSVSPGVELRASSGFSMSLAPRYSRTNDDSQWYDNVTDDDSLGGATHYLFARLSQQTVSVRTRLNLTATPNLSLQLYAEPYVSRGEYSRLREVGDARAEDYARRYVPYPTWGEKRGENYMQFHSNTVLRWEYRPGSTLFFVWSQGRDRYEDDLGRQLQVGRGTRDLFGLHPNNTLLVKASYWFSL